MVSGRPSWLSTCTGAIRLRSRASTSTGVAGIPVSQRSPHWRSATIVGSIETVWAGTVTPPREGIIKRWTYPAAGEEGAIALEKGAEMGRFLLGSTVVMLFPKDSIGFNPDWAPGKTIRMGEAMGDAGA